MKDFLVSCLSRKFVSAHFGVTLIAILAFLSRNNGIDSGVATTSIVSITALLSAYQGANTISKKYNGESNDKPTERPGL